MAACCDAPRMPLQGPPSFPFACDCECSSCHEPCHPRVQQAVAPRPQQCCAPSSACCVLPPCCPAASDAEEVGASTTATQPVINPQAKDPLAMFQHMLQDSALLGRLFEECLGFAITHAITMLRQPPLVAPSGDGAAAVAVTPAGPSVIHAPLTLLPTRLPARLYEQVRTLAPLMSLLYERVSRDVTWLADTLRPTASVDPFVARLLQLLITIEAEARAPEATYSRRTLALALNRSDYMLHEENRNGSQDAKANGSPSGALSLSSPNLSLKQVEFNCISVGAGSLCSRVSELHRYLLDRYLTPAQQSGLQLPANDATRDITDAMAHAHKLFMQQQGISADAPSPLVLFVVQARESNLSDQKQLEYQLWRAHRIPVRRITLAEVAREARIDQATGQLWLQSADGESSLVSLVYFRAGYTPRDFPSEAEWTALSLLERSVAVQCPSLAYHLSGTKRVQQALTLPGALERFIPGEGSEAQQQRTQLRAVFAGQWTLSSDAVARALAQPSRFVLKPQREGGGNNLWGNEMCSLLREATLEQRQAYVLMEVLGVSPALAPSVPTLKGGKLEMVRKATSELGIIGAMITGAAGLDQIAQPQQRVHDDADEDAGSASSAQPLVVYRNSQAGYLLRTKESSLNEGGLMSGAGALDSLVLVP